MDEDQELRLNTEHIEAINNLRDPGETDSDVLRRAIAEFAEEQGITLK